MNRGDWDSSNNIYDMFEFIKDMITERQQRLIACEFTRLIWDELPEIGKDALVIAEHYAIGEIELYECEKAQTKLQSLLPNDDHAHVFSPVIWCLEESTDSYPVYYTAALAASNISELTNLNLCDILREKVQPFSKH